MSVIFSDVGPYESPDFSLLIQPEFGHHLAQCLGNPGDFKSWGLVQNTINSVLTVLRCRKFVDIAESLVAMLMRANLSWDETEPVLGIMSISLELYPTFPTQIS